MKPTKVSVSFGLTINLANYESARFDVGLEADIEDGEDVDTCHNELVEQLGMLVKRDAIQMNRLARNCLGSIESRDKIKQKVLKTKGGSK